MWGIHNYNKTKGGSRAKMENRTLLCCCASTRLLDSGVSSGFFVSLLLSSTCLQKWLVALPQSPCRQRPPRTLMWKDSPLLRLQRLPRAQSS